MLRFVSGLSELVRGEALKDQTTDATGAAATTIEFDYPWELNQKEVYLEKISLNTNSNNPWAQAFFVFYQPYATAQLIGEQRMYRFNMVGKVFNPPIIWPLDAKLQVVFTPNSGASTIIKTKVEWSYTRPTPERGYPY